MLPFRIASVFFLAISFSLSGSARADIKPKDAIKYTKDLKTSKDKKVRITALEELAKIGQIQKALIEEAIPDMMKALEDKEPEVRAAAAKAVGMIDPDADEVVPKLMKMIKEDKEEAVKIGAIQGLGQMGPSAKSAVKELREMYPKDKDKDKKTKPDKIQQEVMKAMRMINVNNK